MSGGGGAAADKRAPAPPPPAVILFEPGKEVVLGRGVGCTIVLPDVYISRKHIKFSVAASAVKVTYLGSAKQFARLHGLDDLDCASAKI